MYKGVQEMHLCPSMPCINQFLSVSSPNAESVVVSAELPSSVKLLMLQQHLPTWIAVPVLLLPTLYPVKHSSRSTEAALSFKEGFISSYFWLRRHLFTPVRAHFWSGCLPRNTTVTAFTHAGAPVLTPPSAEGRQTPCAGHVQGKG